MNRPKMGFLLPPRLFEAEIRELLGDYLTEERLSKGGIFEPRATLALRDRVLRGEPVQFEKYWFPLAFEMWRARWL